MKQSKSVFKFLLLAIVLSLIYFKFHSKPCDPYTVENYNVDIEMTLNEIKTVPVTIGTFEALRGSIFLRNASESDDSNVFAALPFDDFADINATLMQKTMGQRREQKQAKCIGELYNITLRSNATKLQKFFWNITQYHLYPADSDVIDKILLDMATQPIQGLVQNTGGTQFKLVVNYDNEASALFKPMRTSRDEGILPNQMYFTELERHNAEIAAYHLDRVLGFRKAIPATGRKINMITDILRIADQELQKSFFISPQPDENICFSGNCEQYCDEYHPICGDRDVIEGSFVIFIPQQGEIERISRYHPWRRTYMENEIAIWESDPNYCTAVRASAPFDNIDFLFEIIEMAIFDFLIGNSDRHNYQIFRSFGFDSFALRYDHGRAFGNAYHDELKILAPLLQCCIIKDETVETLLRIHNGPKPLSMMMNESMAADPITPILSQPHLDALDRRLSIVLYAIRDCINRSAVGDDVIV